MNKNIELILYIGVMLAVVLLYDFVLSIYIKVNLIFIITGIILIGFLLYAIYLVLIKFIKNKLIVLNIIFLYLDVIAFIVFFWFLPYFNLCSNPPCYFR